MIELNLLPDVKVEYIKAQRLKHLVVSSSILAAGAALVIFLILVLTVDVWQKSTISSLSDDITKKSKELKDTDDLNKILTIQSQLNSLDSLHAEKPVADRLLGVPGSPTPGYIAQVTPASAKVSNLEVDFATNTMIITGKAPSLDVVNVFADALKFTKYRTASDGDAKPAFSGVVLTTFTRNKDGTSYTISLNYDPIIFRSENEVELVIPQAVTTRSVVEQPGVLFEGEN